VFHFSIICVLTLLVYDSPITVAKNSLVGRLVGFGRGLTIGWERGLVA